MKQFGDKSKRRTRRVQIDPTKPCADPRDEEKRISDWKKAPLSSLPGLPKRIVNCLEHAGINTVGELQAKSMTELSELKNFGATSATVCAEKLQACHLQGLRR